MRRERERFVAAFVAAAVLLGACTGDPVPEDVAREDPGSQDGDAPEPSDTDGADGADEADPEDVAALDDCETLAAEIGDSVQEHVNTFADVPPADIADIALEDDETPVLTAEDADRRADGLDCDPDRFHGLLREEIDDLTGQGPVASAVVATLAARLLGTEDPSDPVPATFEIASARELTAALARAGSGSTIRVTVDHLRLEEPLWLLRGVTIEGAGAGATVIESAAAGAAVIALSDGTFGLRDLTLRHVGAEPASLVVVRRGGYDLEGVAVEGGLVDRRGAGGFGIVLRPDPPARPDLPARPDPLERRIVSSVLTGNAGGGIVVAGDEQPTLTDLEISGDGPCGLCVTDRAAAEVRDLRVAGHGVGIGITSTGAPTLRDLVIDAGTVAGVEIRDGRAHLSGVRVTGSPPAGIVIVGGAPDIRGADVRTTGNVGILYDEVGSGYLRDSTITGARVGVRFLGSSSPMVEATDVSGVAETAIRVDEQSAPTLTGLRCDATDSGVLSIASGASPVIGEHVNCPMAD